MRFHSVDLFIFITDSNKWVNLTTTSKRTVNPTDLPQICFKTTVPTGKNGQLIPLRHLVDYFPCQQQPGCTDTAKLSFSLTCPFSATRGRVFTRSCAKPMSPFQTAALALFTPSSSHLLYVTSFGIVQYKPTLITQ